MSLRSGLLQVVEDAQLAVQVRNELVVVADHSCEPGRCLAVDAELLDGHVEEECYFHRVRLGAILADQKAEIFDLLHAYEDLRCLHSKTCLDELIEHHPNLVDVLVERTRRCAHNVVHERVRVAGRQSASHCIH